MTSLSPRSSGDWATFMECSGEETSLLPQVTFALPGTSSRGQLSVVTENIHIWQRSKEGEHIHQIRRIWVSGGGSEKLSYRLPILTLQMFSTNTLSSTQSWRDDSPIPDIPQILPFAYHYSLENTMRAKLRSFSLPQILLPHTRLCVNWEYDKILVRTYLMYICNTQINWYLNFNYWIKQKKILQFKVVFLTDFLLRWGK